MSFKKNLEKKENRLYSDCWYEDVCTLSCPVNCSRYTEMKYLIDNSGIPEARQYPISLEADEDYEEFLVLSSIKSNIVDFVNNGENLYVTSENTGNGKTSWAIKLLLKYFNEIWPGNGLRVRGLFIHVPTLLLQLKNFQDPLSEQYKQNLLNVDLVIWDEMAGTTISGYDYSNLLMFLENRLLQQKSNIYTSNCVKKEDLEEIVGIKLASRIWNTSTIIEFKGKDRRGSFTGYK